MTISVDWRYNGKPREWQSFSVHIFKLVRCSFRQYASISQCFLRLSAIVNVMWFVLHIFFLYVLISVSLVPFDFSLLASFRRNLFQFFVVLNFIVVLLRTLNLKVLLWTSFWYFYSVNNLQFLPNFVYCEVQFCFFKSSC